MTTSTAMVQEISIHAPREGGDVSGHHGRVRPYHFNPRPPRGGRRWCIKEVTQWRLFQSTPPARGATGGEITGILADGISIHAPREGGDQWSRDRVPQSHHFNPRPPRGGRHHQYVQGIRGQDISIHAPREGGDYHPQDHVASYQYHFNPRPPRGGRPAPTPTPNLIIQYFNPRPPRGGRHGRKCR